MTCKRAGEKRYVKDEMNDVQNTVNVKQIYGRKSVDKSDDLFKAKEPNDESHHDKYNYGEKLINFTIDSLKEFNIEITVDHSGTFIATVDVSLVNDDVKEIYVR